MQATVQLSKVFQGRKIGIVGYIGAGKSTLGENVCERNADRVKFLTEYVNREMLKIYIEAPTVHAAAFQQSMAQHALLRQRFADFIVSLQRTWTVFIERPMVENIAFAMANYLVGNMSDANWQFYLLMFNEEREHPQCQCDLLCVLSITDSVSYQRMGIRHRPGENKYTNRYLNILNRVHFIMVLGWIIAVPTGGPPVCIIENEPFCSTDEALFKMECALFYRDDTPAATPLLSIEFRDRREFVDCRAARVIVIDWDAYRANWRSDIAKCEETESLIVRCLNLHSQVCFLCDDPAAARRCCALDAGELKRWF